MNLNSAGLEAHCALGISSLPAELQVTFFLQLHCSVCVVSCTQTRKQHQHNNNNNSSDTDTHRDHHRVLLLEFGDVFVSSGDLGLVQRPEATHHPHPALRRIHHVCGAAAAHANANKQINK